TAAGGTQRLASSGNLSSLLIHLRRISKQKIAASIIDIHGHIAYDPIKHVDFQTNFSGDRAVLTESISKIVLESPVKQG
ncbi:hypothetical protein JW905_02735, partial [bacterium]|nr:hypothetical protein [candidate division CSSED10-310 bacterium]